MIGVILWSDAEDQKAVIWCEDQGDLAFLSSPDHIHLPDTFFEVGDMVSFDVSTRRNMRLAHNPSRVGTSLGSALVDDLQNVANAEQPVSEPAKIVPFRLESAQTSSARSKSARRRQG